MTGPASARVPRWIAITAPDAPLDARFESWLADLAEARVDAVQIRRKELGDRGLLALVERAVAALSGTAIALLVNGRADIARAAGATGVHLPAAGIPTPEARRLLEGAGGRALVGRSTHRIGEIERERRAGADYVTYGPVHETPGKERYGEPKGLDGPEGLAAACAVGVPVLALGGVSPESVGAIAAAGGAGVAAIRACSGRGPIGELAAAVREAFPRPPVGAGGPPPP